jgi:hypothetical protein
MIKTKVENINNPTEIPVEIEELERRLGGFESSDTIDFIYQNGVIALKHTLDKEFLEFGLETVASYATKREDTISGDLILMMKYGDDKDKENLKRIISFGNSIFKEKTKGKKKVVELFFGLELENNIELSSRQLKKIISDGDRIGNRKYPFEFSKEKVKITVKNSDPSKKDQISRELYSKKYTVSQPFEITFSTKLSNAVNNISGYIIVYVDKNAPMLLMSKDLQDKGIDMAYLINKF